MTTTAATTIHLYELTLVLDTPGGVAAPESRPTDTSALAPLPLARDADGRPHVPATSLAGSLRAHAEQAVPGGAAPLFGSVGTGRGEHREGDAAGAVGAAGGANAEDDEDDEAGVDATASRIRFLGTRTTLPEEASEPLLRASTAIDRDRGAAASSTLRTRELLPPGTTVTVWLRVDDPDAAGEVERLLPTWSPRVGGGRTTGHGRARLTRVTRRVLDLATREGRRVWLTRGGPALFDATAATVIHTAPAAGPDPGTGPGGAPAPRVFPAPLRFAIVDPLHVGSGSSEDRGHHATDVARHLRDHRGRPVVPGTTWKGVLRSRCEFILRSLADAEPQDLGGDGPPAPAFAALAAAFGHTEPTETSEGLRGRLVFLDSPVHDARTAVRNHVGLDRFTGGAAPGVLYTEEVVERGRVELTLLDEPSDPQAGPLDPVVRDVLLLALYDLHTGALGIGGGTTRGYGTLRGHAETAEFLEQEAPAARRRLAAAFPAPDADPVSEEVPA